MDKKKLEQREALRAIIREELANAVSENSVTPEEAEKSEQLSFGALDERIEQLEKATRTYHLPGSEEATHRGETYSFARALGGLVYGDIEKRAPMEFAMSEELKEQQWAQGTNVDTKGGFLVPTQVFEDQIIPLLRPQVIVLDLGITQLPVTGAGIVEIPRETTGPSVSNVAENQASSETELEFGNHRLEPRCAQTFIKASRRFLDIGVGADQFIRQRMAEELALRWNLWTLKGTGSNGEPIGVLNSAGVNTVDFDTTTTIAAGRVKPAFYKALLEMEDALVESNAYMGATSLGWATGTKFIRAARQIESDNNTAGTSNLEMNRHIVTDGQLPTLLNYPYRRTTQLASGATTEAIFGDWSKAVLATWNNLSIEASNTANDALQKRQTHIVAYIDVDVAVTQPTAFAVAENCNTSSI